MIPIWTTVWLCVKGKLQSRDFWFPVLGVVASLVFYYFAFTRGLVLYN